MEGYTNAIDQLEDHHIHAIVNNMTTHALLTTLLTGDQVAEEDMLALMHDHINEIVSS